MVKARSGASDSNFGGELARNKAGKGPKKI